MNTEIKIKTSNKKSLRIKVYYNCKQSQRYTSRFTNNTQQAGTSLLYVCVVVHQKLKNIKEILKCHV